MRQITPGKWTVERYKEPYNSHLFTYHVINDQNLIVAKCGTGDFEIPDNARLIAAAPEMLEAIKKAVEWIEDDRFDEDYITEDWYHKMKDILGR